MPKRRYLLHAPRAPGPLAGTLTVLWHGAGGDIDHPTLDRIARVFAARGGHVARARFPYRVEGRRAPDRMPKLVESARSLLASLTDDQALRRARLILGGRSMGGRMASMLVAEGFAADGVLLLSYPLHPANKRDQLRDAHLRDVPCPMLFVQGDRDPMADLALLRPVLDRLRGRATLEVFPGDGHGMTKADPDAVADVARRWAESLPPDRH